MELERSTLADWVGASSRLLQPLVKAMRDYGMQAGKLHADDTPVPVLAPGNGKTKTGRLWTCVRDDRPAADRAAPAVWFAYSTDRKGEHPEQHLREFRGTLQADAYAGFNQLYESGRIEQAARWAHVRRHFYDLEHAHASPTARETLQGIGAPYRIEETIRCKPPDERRALRQAQSKPLLDSLRQWFETTLATLSQVGHNGRDSLRALALGRAGTLYKKMATSRSTTTLPNACAGWPWAGRTTCLPDRMLAENVQRRCTASSAQQNSMDSIPKPICGKC